MKNGMSDEIQLIIGLGNPGTKYRHTRHNAGEDFVEQLAAKLLVNFIQEKKYSGRYAKAFIGSKPVHLLIPNTFMNLSGTAVSALANFYKIPAQNILVAHDELDINPGVNNKDFYRLRIGICHPGQATDVADFVLSKAPQKEQQMTRTATDEALLYTSTAVAGDWQGAMNKLHSFKAS